MMGSDALRTFALGDIHGRLGALTEVLTKCGISDDDRLIILGDVCDGGRKTKQCIDKLMTVKNTVLVVGNHDAWCLDWFLFGKHPRIWVDQGGRNTMWSYDNDVGNVPEEHITFLRNAKPYFIDEQNRIYVHGGFVHGVPIERQRPYDIMWDRDLIMYAREHVVPGYNHVFVGHTSTQIVVTHEDLINGIDPMAPRTFHNLTMLDTGGGWSGKLTIMDVDTFEYWQSKRQVPNDDEGW